jgi:hypothetical protein
MLLRMMSLWFPTSRLASAYFDNLKELLGAQSRREQPGVVVLGIGSGRCGSTTLGHAMKRVRGACATHENPPMIYWEPCEEQLSFHVERFRLLTQYFAVVFDASYWWLNARERIFREFPQAKAIGLCRETHSCVESFMAQKGSGKGSLNHWAPPDNGIWATSPGDPCLPSYPLPETSGADPDAAKRSMLERYVGEYNAALVRLAETLPERVLLVRTEELNSAETYAQLSDFLGVELPQPTAALNVGTNADGMDPEMIF